MALYQQVKDHVMRKIADGSLSAGERVPSEQELVQEFGVARMTANRALRELAEQGVIEPDEAARAVLAQAYPDREIVPVPCRSLIWQNGSLHCITMQLPEGLLA